MRIQQLGLVRAAILTFETTNFGLFFQFVDQRVTNRLGRPAYSVSDLPAPAMVMTSNVNSVFL